VGSILRRLASKLAVRDAMPVVGPCLKLLEVGVWVKGGIEGRKFTNHLAVAHNGAMSRSPFHVHFADS
jgi:hypothetical protein